MIACYECEQCEMGEETEDGLAVFCLAGKAS